MRPGPVLERTIGWQLPEEEPRWQNTKDEVHWLWEYRFCEDFSSVWSDTLVKSVKIEDDGDATDFENEDDFNYNYDRWHKSKAFG